MSTTQANACWRIFTQRVGEKPRPRGLDARWHALAGLLRKPAYRTARYLELARRITAQEAAITELPDDQIRQAIQQAREQHSRSRQSPQSLLDTMALLREVCRRKLDMHPYPVQLAGALALCDGTLIEMATGEGKTLTAALAAIIAGFSGKGCHVVTVNDYLAQRDADLMRPLYTFCGLSVGVIQQDTPPPQRQEAYRADITYGTNKEIAADFLRDRLTLGSLNNLGRSILENISSPARPLTDQLIQRGLGVAIIDEADSILIDEAVTPLIISGESGNEEEALAYEQAAEIADTLLDRQDYQVDRKHRRIKLTPAGKEHLQELTDELGGFWAGSRRSREMIDLALVAKELYQRDRHYTLQEDKVVIIDESTGRLMPDRSWRDGLHQAVEAKEQVTVNPPKDTFARISFQKFYGLYDKLCGMSGTVRETTAELWSLYDLQVVMIPPHRPSCRTGTAPQIFVKADQKWQAILEEIHCIHQTGRPILIGTRSVLTSEHLSALLQEEGLDHDVLNAVNHEQEAQIIAQAGQVGRIVVATNMAGRGTDIKLSPEALQLGGLHVIATEMNESSRLDRQLFGRCGRQGDPGTTSAFFSLEDELMPRLAPDLLRLSRCWGLGRKKLEPASSRALLSSVHSRANRQVRRLRKRVMNMDHWLSEQLGFAGAE